MSSKIVSLMQRFRRVCTKVKLHIAAFSEFEIDWTRHRWQQCIKIGFY